MERIQRRYTEILRSFLFGLMLALLASCNGADDDRSRVTPTVSPTPTARATASSTPVPTPTPAPTPALTRVDGLVVLRRDVPTGPQDAVAPPPAGWAEGADAEMFDRALGRASLRLVGPVTVTAESNLDGTFAIPAIPPGNYRLEIEKVLNGNLVQLEMPLELDSTHPTRIVVQVGWGKFRVVADHGAGTAIVQVRATGKEQLRLENGRLVELVQDGQQWRDDDGDGILSPISCTRTVWECGRDFACDDGSPCVCTSSCPACDDCGPGICAPGGASYAYRCDESDSCPQPGDVCVCVASCPTCADCNRRVCVPDCAPLELKEIAIEGAQEVVVGRSIGLQALARFSNGKVIDVTRLVTWAVSDETIASIDSWGQLAARAVGAVEVTARLGSVTSETFPVRVVERSSLVRIVLRNASCWCPILARPGSAPSLPGGALPPCILLDQPSPDFLPIPGCREVVQVGRTLQLVAVGEFADGSAENITDEVQWSIAPPTVATIERGLLRATAAGEASITAALGTVASEPLRIRVVEQPTPVTLRIFAQTAVPALPVEPSDPTVPAVPPPCLDCDGSATILIGDTLQFTATVEYDTGEWEEVTDRVTWQSSDEAVASFPSPGILQAHAAGTVRVDAVLESLRSNAIEVRVVPEASVTTLHVYPESSDRVVATGSSLFFRATALYDLGFARDVTDTATWHSSDPTIASFSAGGELTGREPGRVHVWAEFAGTTSNRVEIEVYTTHDIVYCDPSKVNRAVWADAFNRVVLESDCDHYDIPSTVTLRYTVTETQPHGGIFDPCLDLYVYRGFELVRVLREEGCGQPVLGANEPGRDQEVLRYQTLAFWDLRDQRGELVPPGIYRIYGRFFLYYDPVVYLDIAVGSPSPRPTPTPTSLTSGCYLGSCSGGLLAGFDRDACCAYARTALHPFAVLWCDQIVDGVCAAGACQSPCEVKPACCPPGAPCIPELPPCPRNCCPPGTSCGPVLPPCEVGCTGDGRVPNCTPDPSALCPAIAAPVCGCDGRTYGNACELSAACVQLAHEGPCEAAPR